MDGKTCLLVFLAFTTLYNVVNGQDDYDFLELTDDELTCITTNITQASPTPSAACRDVIQALERIYDAEDLGEGIAANSNLFTAFCQESCAQVYIDAFEACDVVYKVFPEINFLLGLCDSNDGTKCHTYVTNLLRLVSNDSACAGDIPQESGSQATCSVPCGTSLMQAVSNYGCCINAAIDYLNYRWIDPVPEAAVNALFSVCAGVQRPSECTTAVDVPTIPPQSTPPPRQTQGTTQPTRPPGSSGTGQPTAAAAVMLIASFIAVYMHS